MVILMAFVTYLELEYFQAVMCLLLGSFAWGATFMAESLSFPHHNVVLLCHAV